MIIIICDIRRLSGVWKGVSQQGNDIEQSCSTELKIQKEKEY
jgi:hypothetical protein